MGKYAFIVGVTYGYIPELCALLNSLDFVGSEADVHVIGIELPEDFIKQFDNLRYKVIHHNVTEPEWQAERGRSEVVCRKRYWYAAEIGEGYDAVCVLDADLIFVRNPVQYFFTAEKTGYILGPCKEQNKTYDDDHHLVGGEWIWNVERGFYNDKDLCNCPIFLDAKLWGPALRFSWDIFLNAGFRAPDMDAMNLAFLQYGSYSETVLLAGNQWLGTNEQHLKPYIRAINSHEKIQTESGIPVFSYHGQYYHKKWRDCQLNNRHRCAEGYLKATECSDSMAKGAMGLLYAYFLEMLEGPVVIERKNYRHPELPYEG